MPAAARTSPADATLQHGSSSNQAAVVENPAVSAGPADAARTRTQRRPLPGSATPERQRLGDSQPQRTPDQAETPAQPALKVVDIADVAKRFRNDLTPHGLEYVEHLETFVPQAASGDTDTAGHFRANVMPSLLRRKEKSGDNTLRSVLQPAVAPDGVGLANLQLAQDGALHPERAGVWQFRFSLVKAVNVAKTGLKHARQVHSTVARVCLLDKQTNRFLGNVHVEPTKGPPGVKEQPGWQWDPHEGCVVRCSCTQPDAANGSRELEGGSVSLYIELNVAFKLQMPDTKVLPVADVKARRIVEELTCCWALVNVQRCADMAREVEIAVPLYYGSIYEPQLLSELLKHQALKRPVHSLLTGGTRAPVLVFRVGPMPARPLPLVQYSYMPPTMLAGELVASALGAYRLALAQHMAERGGNCASTVSDAALAAFPGILEDKQLLEAFKDKWQTACADGGEEGCMSCSEGRNPARDTVAGIVEAFKKCCLELEPLLHCATLPPRHMSNFVEHQAKRSQVVADFVQQGNRPGNRLPRSPLDPLSHAGVEFLHRPFNVSETRVCILESVFPARAARALVP